MKQVIFESPPAYILLCAILALALGYWMYTAKHSWSKTWNRILFALRSVLLFCLFFLLLGPIVKQINNIFEKPVFIVLHDNSTSVKETTDSTDRNTLDRETEKIQEFLNAKGYDAKLNDLNGEAADIAYTINKTDLHTALKRITSRYEGKTIGGVVLVSDGIYNAGISPLYTTYNFPIHTIGVGDTLQRSDIAIKNIAYNKIAYQGNKFPVRAEIAVKSLESQPIEVSLYQRGKLIEKKTQTSKGDQLLVVDFLPVANEKGIQKFDIRVAPKLGEVNVKNNSSSVFVDVVEGKKKILVVAPAPHPDIKVLREVVEKNSNYEFLLHIPTLSKKPEGIDPENIDLVIFYQSPDLKGTTRELFRQYAKSKTSLLVVLGQQSDLRLLSQSDMPLSVEGIPRDYDEVTPVINTAFSSFTISSEAYATMSYFPPVSVHFGRINFPQSSVPLLYQRVGNLTTQKPLLAVDVKGERKIGVLLGEGIWRWRLNEYDRTESTVSFDEVFGKLIQYLSTSEDKRKFKSYPIQQEFSETEEVVFESQVFNDLFEPVFGNTIMLEVTDESGRKQNYSYITSEGNSRYQIGGVKEGVYKYKASTDLKQKKEVVSGEFAVVARDNELQNLTADFDLLRKLSANSGGQFYKLAETEQLIEKLNTTQAKSIIHSEESYKALINLKWVFWILIALVSLEWFVRKYHGSY